ELGTKLAQTASLSSTTLTRTYVLLCLQKGAVDDREPGFPHPFRTERTALYYRAHGHACPGTRDRPDPAAESRRRGVRPRRHDAERAGDRGGHRGDEP